MHRQTPLQLKRISSPLIAATVPTTKPSLLKLEHLFNLRGHRDLGTDDLDRVSQTKLRLEQELHSSMEGFSRIWRYSSAAQTNCVDIQDMVISLNNAEWRDIACDPCHACDHCSLSNPSPLVNAGHSADVGSSLYGHVPGATNVVCDCHIIFDHAIVAKVNVRHDEATVGDFRRGVINLGSVDRNVFPNHVIIANNQLSRGVFKISVLGQSTQNRALGDIVPRSDGCS
jgi:hypothetical protein